MKRRDHSLQGIPDGKYREARRYRREMTDSEWILWTRVRRNQINGMHFRRQHVILGFILDFYCQKVKLAIEVDGGIHRARIEQDFVRDEILTSKGILVLRINNERIMHTVDEMVEEISRICRHRLEMH